MQPASFAVLRSLSDGRLRTHADLVESLGITPGALRAALAELDASGVGLSHAPDACCALRSPFDALDPDAIGRALGRQRGAISLELLDVCASTSTLLAARASAGAPTGTAIACELQTAGRGRRGACWAAPLGSGVTFSLLWRIERGAAALAGLSLVAGVACARALEGLGYRDVALKWPNDLLRDDCKLGGILVELAGEPTGPVAAVIGIGVNVRLPATAQDAIGAAAADLSSGVASPPSRSLVLGRMLAALVEALPVFAREGFGGFRSEWLDRHAWQGRRVRVLAPSRSAVEGVAAGVADDGALLVDTGGVLERFHSAEVSLRRAA